MIPQSCFWAGDCRYLHSTGWVSEISLSWGQARGEIPFLELQQQYPYVSFLLSSRQKVIPMTNSEGFLFLCNLSCSSVSGWWGCLWHRRTAGSLSRLSVSSSSRSLSGQRILSALLPQLLPSDSVSSLLILNGLERMEVGGGGKNLLYLQFWQGSSGRGCFLSSVFKAGHGSLL